MIDKKVRVYMNYKRKNKWLGIIEYKSLSAFLIYSFIVGAIINLLPICFEWSVYIFLFLVFPLLGLLLVNVNGNDILDMINDIFSFNKIKGIYVKNVQSVKKFKKIVYK
ncbi:MAG: hypothetical protein RSB67_03145 [Clostridia bacterium]